MHPKIATEGRRNAHAALSAADP